MTQPTVPFEPFAQHPRLAELVNALHFRRHPLFLAGLLYEHAGRVPTSRLFDDDALAQRSDQARAEVLDELNQEFLAVEVAAWTRGRRSVNEVGQELLRHWFLPHRSVPLAITGSEVLGVVPLEVTDALLAVFRHLADRHDRGYMVEHVMELLATG